MHGGEADPDRIEPPLWSTAIARRYHNRGLEFSDLMAGGQPRPLRAVDRLIIAAGLPLLDLREVVVTGRRSPPPLPDRARTIRIPVDVVAERSDKSEA